MEELKKYVNWVSSLSSGCFGLFASNHDNYYNCDSEEKWRIRANDFRILDPFVFHANIGLRTSNVCLNCSAFYG